MGDPEGAAREAQPDTQCAGGAVQPDHVEGHPVLDVRPLDDPADEHRHHGVQGRAAEA